jgi:hypothetical protein
MRPFLNSSESIACGGLRTGTLTRSSGPSSRRVPQRARACQPGLRTPISVPGPASRKSRWRSFPEPPKRRLFARFLALLLSGSSKGSTGESRSNSLEDEVEELLGEAIS